MTMAAEQFEALVRKCEAHAKRDREGYARQVTVLALAGYGYVLLVLVGLGGTITLLVWSLQFHGATYRVLALTAPFVLLSRLVLRALRVRVERPEGVRVRRTDAPELFALIDLLAPAPHPTPAPRATDRGLQRRAGPDSPPRAARLVPQLPPPRPRGDAGTVARGAPALAGPRARA